MTVKTALVIIAAMITVFTMFMLINPLVNLLKQKLGEVKFRRLTDYAEKAVRAAKQLYVTNERKRQYVFEKIKAYATAIGIDIDSDFIELILEGTYNMLKEEFRRSADDGNTSTDKSMH